MIILNGGSVFVWVYISMFMYIYQLKISREKIDAIAKMEVIRILLRNVLGEGEDLNCHGMV